MTEKTIRKSVSLTILAALMLTGCNTPGPGPALVTLPELDKSEAVTMRVRSVFNPAPIKHHHILSLDGQKIARLEESDRDEFQIAQGAHTLELTCHTRNTAFEDGFPVNYNVSDGDASLEVTAQAGDEICIEVGFKTFSCATLDVAEPEFCQ